MFAGQATGLLVSFTVNLRVTGGLKFKLKKGLRYSDMKHPPDYILTILPQVFKTHKF